MAATTSPSADAGQPATAPAGADVVRFDAAGRVLHWVNAALFLVLLMTAAALYVAPLSTLVGRRSLLRDVHVIAGLALPLPLVAAAFAAARRPRSLLRADLTELNRWSREDRRWFRALGGRRGRPVGLAKFHPLQKLNAAFTAGVVPVMLATGAVMRWFTPFPDDWRTGATFVHDWLGLAVFAAVVAHVVKAVGEPEAIRGMVTGRVAEDWARRRHPRWAPGRGRVPEVETEGHASER